MNIYELQKKINPALDEEVRAYAAKDRRSGGLGSMNIGDNGNNGDKYNIFHIFMS